jgi:hypothetical protein
MYGLNIEFYIRNSLYFCYALKGKKVTKKANRARRKKFLFVWQVCNKQMFGIFATHHKAKK